MMPTSYFDAVCSLPAGLQSAKQALLEMVILPTIRNDLFQGLRRPAKGFHHLTTGITVFRLLY